MILFETKFYYYNDLVGFHLSHRLTENFPESCLLIILGLIVGALLYVTHLAEQKAYVLNSDTFFLFLLPVRKRFIFTFDEKYISMCCQ
jgi:hypothetical protein